MSWADAAAPIVAEVIRRVGRTDMRVLRKPLTDAFPWGERENTPYKAWLAEVRHQLGHPLNAPRADPANQQTDMFNQHLKIKIAVGFRNKCEILEIPATTKTEKIPHERAGGL